MIHTRIATSYIKRTIRPTYGFTQATPKSMFLDPAWGRTVPIWPGMAFMRTSGESVTLINSTGVPYGLVGNYIGGDGVDELLEAGINTLAVWVLAPDAEFEIMAPAFDATQTWTDNGDGSEQLIYAQTTGANQGKLVPSGTTGASSQPVARLLKVNSPSKITIGGVR